MDAMDACTEEELFFSSSAPRPSHHATRKAGKNFLGSAVPPLQALTRNRPQPSGLDILGLSLSLGFSDEKIYLSHTRRRKSISSHLPNPE